MHVKAQIGYSVRVAPLTEVLGCEVQLCESRNSSSIITQRNVSCYSRRPNDYLTISLQSDTSDSFPLQPKLGDRSDTHVNALKEAHVRSEL